MNNILCKYLYDELFHFSDRLECILDSNNIDSSDIIYVKFFLKTFKEDELMNHVISKMLPWRDQIKNKNDNFFYKNKEIFGKLPENKVNYFSDLWKSNKLTNEILINII